jgi:hypothetical protein
MRIAAIEGRRVEPERAGRGIVVFWSTILLFLAGLVWWTPRHRMRRAPAATAAPARAAASKRILSSTTRRGHSAIAVSA